MTDQDGESAHRFVTTKSYRRFGEMCDACRRSRVVGLGYGPQAREKPSPPSSTRDGDSSNPSYRSP
ncbi:hypothetical protein KSF_000100 [Reticulibacter mediterranei]|uniref:Uncharacterized protein n=1 Tax=Reticulibacter mediterranei TaxID=2778369 RepID=A0A8J3MXL7_9CHLR|nr:hypothetical protein KSF_000100 [Reticulibacter mediterranei]